ncbi:ColR [Pseudomonas putida S11]|nr:ColR [Pseudomonas putida S11]
MTWTPVEVTRQGRLLKLNPVGLKLLAVLMQKSPHVLRREVLEEALWGDDCPDSDSLRSHVHQLRQVIDKPFEKTAAAYRPWRRLSPRRGP